MVTTSLNNLMSKSNINLLLCLFRRSTTQFKWMLVTPFQIRFNSIFPQYTQQLDGFRTTVLTLCQWLAHFAHSYWTFLLSTLSIPWISRILFLLRIIQYNLPKFKNQQLTSNKMLKLTLNRKIFTAIKKKAQVSPMQTDQNSQKKRALIDQSIKIK